MLAVTRQIKVYLLQGRTPCLWDPLSAQLIRSGSISKRSGRGETAGPTMGNRTLGHHAVQGSSDAEKEMEGEKSDWYRREECERKRLRDEKLMEVFTHTDPHTCTHAHTLTHSTSCTVYIYLWMPPLYGTPFPESSSFWPAPACAALLPKLILHDPFTRFQVMSSTSGYASLSAGNKLTLTCHSFCLWLYLEGVFTKDEHFLNFAYYKSTTRFMSLVGHSMHTYSLDCTTQKQFLKFGWTLLTNVFIWKFHTNVADSSGDEMEQCVSNRTTMTIYV